MNKNICNRVLWVVIALLMLGMLGGCKKEIVDDHEYQFLVPNGTPLLALSTLFDSDEKMKYEVVSGSAPLIAGFTSGDYDFIVAPINVGAKMFKNDPKYILYKTIIWGNFYLASLNEINTLDDLKGKTITAFSANSSPDIMLKTILQSCGLLDKVTIEYTDSVASANSLLMTGKAEVIITAEPSATVIKNKKNIYTIDLQKEWQKISDNNSFPQAGIFIKKSMLEKELLDNTSAFLKKVDTYLNDYQDVEKLAAAAVKIDESFVTIGKENLMKAIPNCWISLKTNTEEKEAIEYYAQKLIELGLGAQIGGELPDEAFYFD